MGVANWEEGRSSVAIEEEIDSEALKSFDADPENKFGGKSFNPGGVVPNLFRHLYEIGLDQHLKLRIVEGE
jgi:hypothetical protein